MILGTDVRGGSYRGGGEALSGSCVQVPESASEGFLLSAPSPGGVDRVRHDAGEGPSNRKRHRNP